MKTAQKLTDDSIRKVCLSEVNIELATLKEELKTNFQHFNTFNDFVNWKLVANKNNALFEEMSTLEKNPNAYKMK